MALKPYSGPIVNPAAEQPEPVQGPTAAQSAAGLLRDITGSAISATGGLIEAGAQVARKIGKNTGLDTSGSAADALAGGARATSQYGHEVQQNAAPAYREKVAGTQLTGELADLSTWSAGKDPSLLGAASLLAQGLGSTIPTIAAGALTRGRLLPSAAVAAGVGGGFAAQGERDRVLAMSDAELAKLPGYQQRLATMTPEQARVSLAEDAATGAFETTAPISAADVLFEVLPFTGAAQRALAGAVGPGRLARAAAGGAAGAVGEGLQEVGESAAQALGGQEVTGEQGPIFQNTLSDFALGAGVGGLLGVGGGLTSSPDAMGDAEAAPGRGAPAAEPGQVPEPAPVPVQVEDTIVDPAAGPLSRAVATTAAEELGSPVVTPVRIRTPLAEESALTAQGDQQKAFDKDQQRLARKQATDAERAPAAAANDDNGPGVPVMITLAMRRDLAGMGYNGGQIAAMKPAEAWTILQSAGAESATPAPITTASGAAGENDNGTISSDGTGQFGRGSAAADAAGPQGTAVQGGQEGGQGQEVRQEEGQGQGQGAPVRQEGGAEAGQGAAGARVSGVDPTPEPMEGDITPPSSDRFTIRDAAERVKNRTPGAEVIELSDGGFVVRTPRANEGNDGTGAAAPADAELAGQQDGAEAGGGAAGGSVVPADAAAGAAGSEGVASVADWVPDGAAPSEENGTGVPVLEGAGAGTAGEGVSEQPAAGESGDANSATAGEGVGTTGEQRDVGGEPVGEPVAEELTDEAQSTTATAGAGTDAAGGGEAAAGGGTVDAGAGTGTAGEAAGNELRGADAGAAEGLGPGDVRGDAPGEPGAAGGAARGEAGRPDVRGDVGPLTEDEWTAADPTARRKAIDAVIAAGGMRAGLTPRVLWKNLREDERAALGPALRGTATADAGAASAPPADDDASAGAADAGTQQPPTSGQDQEPADRGTPGAGDDASDTSLGGGEPAADDTDPTKRKPDQPSAGGEDATQQSESGQTGPRQTMLEDAGEELVGVRSWRNKLKESRTDDASKNAEALLNATTRVDAFAVRLGEGATPGTARFLDLVRNQLDTFTDYAIDRLGIYSGDAPRQRLVAELASDPEQYAKAEAIAAEYVGGLAALGSVLDGAMNVADAQSRLNEALFRPGGERAFWSDMGDAIKNLWRGYLSGFPRSMARTIDGWASATKGDEAEEKAKTKPLNRPKLEGVSRENLPDYRGGKDVTAEDLVKTFGFRGVNYGNYVNAKERQLHTNHAYDALADLAVVMGQPNNTMSLGGTLGLSIGKEGSGKASAHFEPGAKIINITKGRGDGSLAHEWGHALSDYLRGMDRFGGESLRDHLHTTFSLEGLKKKVDSILRGHTFIRGDKRRGPLRTAEDFLRGEYWLKHDGWGVRKETQYKRDGDELGKSYWGSAEEMWARAFESWVFDRLGGYSPYLVSTWVADSATTKATGYRGRPYPFAEERGAFAADFDAIKAALTATEDGHLILSEDYRTPSVRQIEAAREWSRWALENLQTLYGRAVGGHPSARGLFWYESKKGRETGAVPRGFHAYVDAPRIKDLSYVGYPEPLTAAQIDSFGLKAREVPDDSSGIVMTRDDAKGVKWAPLVDALYNDVRFGRMPADNIALRKRVAEFDGAPVADMRMKEAQEALETAIMRRARDIVAEGGTDKSTFDKLLKLYESQPNLNVRTSTSVTDQAYSTPAPLAFLASRLAGIDYTTSVYEPTAGNGMLLLGAAPANASANELNAGRIASLEAQGFVVREGNAMDAVGEFVEADSQDAVIANPPFDALRDEAGKPIKVKFDDYSLGKLDHLIVAESLRAMKPDGKATVIIGANRGEGQIAADDRIFFNWLYSHYNVTGHFEVDGKLYGRQGAGWPVRVITVHGRIASDNVTPQPGAILRVNNWNGVYEQFTEVLGAQERAIELAADPDGGSRTAGESRGAGRGGLPFADGRKGGESGGAGGAGGDGGAAGKQPGESAGAAADPGERAAERVGGSPDEQRVDDGAAEQDRLGEGDGAPPAAADAGGREKRAPRAKPDGADREALTDADNAFQTAYLPASSRQDKDVLVPVNMAQPLRDALARLEDAVGDIDDFAASELGYKSVEAMHDALMGLQVDSVASAIYQNKVRGKGIIIADQTGIGKGRQAAAMLRWALRNGMTPVFVTVKPQLFTDMYNDLADIGSKDVKPLLMNREEWIAAADGKRLFTNPAAAKHAANLRKIVETGKLPAGSNALFMTYSQINKEGNLQREVLNALAPNAFIVLDESHNAGGESNTGEYIRSVLGAVRGNVYLSATYAKRPDNMPVYFRTDISDALEGGSEALIDAMNQGGLPLQTVVANGLVQAGQMFRRERSYDGVSIDTIVDSANREKHERLSDRVTSALRAITEADFMFHDGFMAQLKVQLASKGKQAIDNAGNKAKESVDHKEFSSVVHNFIKQLLLGLKADTAAERAIAALKRGEKPLIALESTMGSFLKEYVAENGLKDGDLLGAYDYRVVLTRALERTRRYTRKNDKGDTEKVWVGLNELDPITRRAYQDAQKAIDLLDDIKDLPASPIDWIRFKIQQAGYSVAEITGRGYAVDYSGEAPKLMYVPKEEQSDKVLTTKKFNSGKLDVVILNVSGSTGISLHASEKFKDQRPRKMIVAQAAADINIFMQMLGRIHRTGQVVLPGYELLNADLPAEKRPTAVLNKKMKSLNANTSSNSESATSIKSADILNKYGDQIVNQYLWDNDELARLLHLDPADPAAENSSVEDDIARKATGRLAIMPVETQLAFYADIEQQYNDLIDFLNKTGQNDLEPRTLDFDAELLEEHTLLDAKNPDSPFGGEAIYGEYRIKAQGKPMTVEEIRAEMAANLDGKTGIAHASALIEELNALVPKRERKPDEPIGADPMAPVLYAGRSFINSHPIGSLWRVEVNGEVYNAVVTDLRNTHHKTGHPYSLSKMQVQLALNGPLRTIVVPGSQWKKIEIAPIQGYGVNLEGAFREQAEGHAVAKIITGNLLGAYGELRGTTSQIISFSKKDGSTEQGILLPKKFSLEKNAYGDFPLRTPANLIRFLSTSTNPDVDRFGVASRDQNIRVVMQNDGGLTLTTPKSKERGGKYFQNKKLLAVTGDFVSSGDTMRVTVPKDKAAAALEAIMSNTAIYAAPSMAEEARAILSTPAKGAKSLPEPVGRVGWVDTGTMERAASKVTAQWRGDIPFVRVVTLAEELPAAAKVGKGWETAEGWYDGDRAVYLVANNIANVNRGLQVLAHEAIGHYGVEAVMGKAQWTQTVGDVAKLRRRMDTLPADMKAAMASAVRRYGDESAGTFAREFLAILAERNVKSGILSRLLAAVRRWLRSMGFPVDAWAADELRTIVHQGAMQVTKRRKARQSGDIRGAAMSERASPFFSAMVEAVEKAQGAPRQADAKAWKGWLDGAQRRGEFKQAERDWLGVDAWLDDQTGPINREAIAGYVRANQVRVEEVEYGKKVQPKTSELVAQVMDVWNRGTPNATDEERDEAVAFATEWAYGDLDTTSAASQLGITRAALSSIKRAGDTAPKYPSYQLPGGENYRELLLTLPGGPKPASKDEAAASLFGGLRYDQLMPGQRADADRLAASGKLDTDDGYQSSHWRERNVLAHVRYNERVDSEGRRVLFLEELQSDWAQSIRKQGLGADPEVVEQDGKFMVRDRNSGEFVSSEFGPMTFSDRRFAQQQADSMKGRGLPNMPFKATDDWAMLAFKRMVRVAAEGGFDRIAWITGDQQAERYDLSKQVDSIAWKPHSKTGRKRVVLNLPGSRAIVSYVDDSGIVRDSGVGDAHVGGQFTGKRLDEVVGKEVADKIMAADAGTLEGDGLKLGGEGMRGFYDKILPSAVGKWAKKLGGKVGTTTINPITKITGGGLSMREIDLPAHSLDVTDAMREVALAGMPLFSRPETEIAVLDNRGRELGRAKTQVEAGRLAARLRDAGKRVAGTKPVQALVEAVDRAARAPRNHIPERFDAEQRAAAEKIATFKAGEALAPRIERIKDQFASRMVQKVFDQFRPLRDLSPEAFMQAHLSKASDGALEGLFARGLVKLRDGAFDIAENTGGFKKVLTDLNGEHDQFLMWVVGNRADRLANEITVFKDGKEVKHFTDPYEADAYAAQLRNEPITMGQLPPSITVKATGRERLFSEDDIKAMKRLNHGVMHDGSDRRAAYATALRELNRYNKSVLDIAEQAGLIDAEGRKVWESDFYVPFYRVMEDDTTNGPGQIKGLLRQQVIKKLNGGIEPLGDPLENILANWSQMLGASMRNMAANKALDAATEMGIAEPLEAQQKKAVWTMRDGKKAWFAVHDAPVLEALESLSFTGYNNPLMRAAGKFKRALTIGVTIGPSFRIRNLARDVASAVATSEVGYNPVRNIVDGLKLTKHDSDSWWSLVTGGGAVRFGVINDGDQAKHAKRMVELGVADDALLDTPEKLGNAVRKAWDWWQEWGDRVETVNRAVIYDRAIKAGKTHLQASFEARDLMNFTSMGSSAAVRALSQVLPFFNARLQGLDRLARGYKADPRRFYATAGVMAMASALLYLLNRDDDDYKNLPDYARDNNWVIRLPGTDHFLYVPKPFEVGALASVVERATELAVAGDDYQARDFAANLGSILSSQLSMNPVPQIVRPGVEAMFNYDMFRHAPIDNLGQMNLLPEDRYTARTSAGAVAAGKLVGMSPQRIEKMVEGYLGWVGTQVLNVSDHLMRGAGVFPKGPQQDASKTDNLFVIGSFVREAHGGSSKYVTRFYETQKELDAIYASATAARKSGDTARALELMNDPKMKARPVFQRAEKQLTAINRQIRAITNHPTMGAAEKSEKLEALNARRNAIAEQVDRAVRGK